MQYKIIGAPKKFKNQPRPLVSTSSLNFSQNFCNLSHETVPLIFMTNFEKTRDPGQPIGIYNSMSYLSQTKELRKLSTAERLDW